MKKPKPLLPFAVVNIQLTMFFFAFFIFGCLGSVSLDHDNQAPYDDFFSKKAFSLQLPGQDPVKKPYPEWIKWEKEQQEENQNENELAFSGGYLIDNHHFQILFHGKSISFFSAKSTFFTKDLPLYLLFQNIRIPNH